MYSPLKPVACLWIDLKEEELYNMIVNCEVPA